MADLRPIGRSLTRLLDEWGLSESFRVASALKAWQELVGHAVAQVARPLRYDGDTLWVGVRSQTWAQELNFQKLLILQRLNERIGHERFRHLRFTVRSNLPSDPNTPTPETATSPTKPSDIEISEAERDAVVRQFAQVADARLRNALIQARLATLRYEKWCAEQGWRQCRGCGCYHQDPDPLCFLCRGEP